MEPSLPSPCAPFISTSAPGKAGITGKPDIGAMYRQIAARDSQRTVPVGQHIVFNDATIIIARLTLRVADR